MICEARRLSALDEVTLKKTNSLESVVTVRWIQSIHEDTTGGLNFCTEKMVHFLQRSICLKNRRPLMPLKLPVGFSVKRCLGYTILE